MKKIKPQRGITYECYIGFTDRTDTRARRGTRYWFLDDNFNGYFYMMPISNKGYAVMILKDKFTSHFIPLNLLD
jgi:hypothetical protein